LTTDTSPSGAAAETEDPWAGSTTALERLSRAAALSALAFAFTYVVSLARLASFFGALNAPYELVRQDPISIAAGSIFLVAPAFLIWGWWRGMPGLQAWLNRLVGRRTAVAGIVFVFAIAAVGALQWFNRQYQWLATLAVLLMAVGYLGAPTSFLSRPQRAFVFAGLLVAGAAIYGWGSALELRDGRSPRHLVTIVADRPIEGLDGDGASDAYSYAGLIFVYKDLEHIFLIPRNDEHHVYAIPVRDVQSIETWEH
jgi:hypothetical protein